VDGLDLDTSHLERVTVLQEHDVVVAPAGPVAGPILAPLVGEVDSGAEPLGEFAGAREEVGVDVRLGHGGDAKALGLGHLHVAIDVPFGIDDKRLARTLTAHEVGVLRELRVQDLSEKHDCLRFGGVDQWGR
jgi:hypothetical protein